MISVCLLSYNGAKYIEAQLSSILTQLDHDDEVIISDDGSTDGTLDIIKDYGDRRIKLCQNHQKVTSYKGTMKMCYNVGRNAENALNKALGDYIFLADQDDIWLPGKVETCLKELQFKDLVITNHIPVDSQLIPLNNIYKPSRIKTPSLLNTLTHTQFLGCCMAFKKKLLPYILPFPSEPVMHDIWIGLMAIKYGKISLIQEPYLLYRRHGNNASVNIEKHSINPISFKLMYRFYLLRAYLKR